MLLFKTVSPPKRSLFRKVHTLTLSRRRPISSRNQSIDLQSKSIDWFLDDIGLRRERLKNHLFSRRGYLVEVFFWKSSYSEKVTATKRWLLWKRKLLKKSCSSEVTATSKEQILCQSSYSEEVWNSFSKKKLS